MSDAAIQLGESMVKLLAERDRLRAENEALQHSLKAVEFQERCNKEMTAGFALAVDQLRAENDAIGEGANRLVADNEKLNSQLTAWFDTAERYSRDSDYWRRECETLRAENESYKQAMRANNMTADAQYLERHLREACLKLGGSACRDGMPMGEGLIREIENLRATALTASEANFLLRCRQVMRLTTNAPLKAKLAARAAAHPEPQEEK